LETFAGLPVTGVEKQKVEKPKENLVKKVIEKEEGTLKIVSEPS
jgi:hypothetical protein